ncbi:MAG: bifunctional phosphopantothenoylcysteine decarboxylase/phosphopantothenate--cysteine ligase CoaBC, partial [Flavobacteriaceae bacterium]
MFPALHAKKVILGISGSIAAYKTPLLVRALIKAGAEVQVVMTPAAKSFVAPLSLSTVSNNAVYSEFVNSEEELWNNHVDLGLWADLMLIAPASANTLSKMAQATCDNLLLAVYLSAKCPVYFAPAMDLDMHEHPATQDAIQRLISRNNIHIPAQEGELASGLQGVGRMQEPDQIVDFLERDLSSKMPLLGIKMMVTAGPTYEPLDPVRYIGNYSSGKMGYAIANEAAAQG